MPFDKLNIHIGIDFDHTIVDYHSIFGEKACALGFIDSKKKMSKNEVKIIVKESEDGERKWGILQSEVYSQGIREAVIMKGFLEFVKACRKGRISLSVISHKNRSNPYDLLNRDLQEPALDWMKSHHFFEKSRLGFSRKQVFFDETIEDKVVRIKALNCSHFVDDLLKVFSYPRFPESTRKILYLNNMSEKDNTAVDFLGDWRGITKYLILEEPHEA